MWLILNTYGNRLTCKKGRFQVKNEARWQRISPRKVEGICMAEPGMISTDAIRLAVSHEIPIILLDRNGKPIGRFWSAHYRALARIRRQQVRFGDSELAGPWMLQRLQRKSAAQQDLLVRLAGQQKKKGKKMEQSLAKIQFFTEELSQLSEKKGEDLYQSALGLEGNLAKEYFKAISRSLPEPYQFDSRSRRPSRDLFNAVLNYLYGMLYQQTESALIHAGLDPYLPVWHSDRRYKPALVYDFVEPYRVWADETVIDLCRTEALREQDHATVDAHKVWLSPTGKKLVIETFQQFVQQKQVVRQQRLSRLYQLEQEARQFAQYLLRYDQTPDV